MLARIRVSIPDQPGTLGRVASAIGVAGADVHEIQVLGSDLGRATDDVWVRLAGPGQLDRLVRGLASIPGVVVEGVRSNVSGVSRLGELELISAILANHDLQVLVDQAVAGLDATWAAVVDRPVLGLTATRAAEVLVSSAQGPAIGSTFDLPIRLAARETEPHGSRAEGPAGLPGSDKSDGLRAEGPAGLPGSDKSDGLRAEGPAGLPGSDKPGSMVVVPLPPTQGALVMARQDGPAYHATEVFRLGELGRVLGRVLARISSDPVAPQPQSRSTM